MDHENQQNPGYARQVIYLHWKQLDIMVPVCLNCGGRLTVDPQVIKSPDDGDMYYCLKGMDGCGNRYFVWFD